MSEHTGLPVHGYTAQSQDRVDLVNANKELEERVLRNLEGIACKVTIDLHWVTLAKTHFEQGFMALNRAIFRPARVSLPGDTP